MMQNDMMGWDVNRWPFCKGELILSGTGEPHCLHYMLDKNPE